MTHRPTHSRPNKLRLLIGLAAGLMLAACQTTQEPAEGRVATADTNPLQSIGPSMGQLGADRLPQAAPQLVLRPKINDDPTQVVGMQPRDLQSLLGRPQFVRRDLSAEIWQYRQARCVLDLFLYGDAGADHKVVYFEVRPLRHDAGGLSESAQRGCIASLILSGNAA